MFLQDGSTGYFQWVRDQRPSPRENHAQYRRLGTASDGNCIFHALARGLSEIYQNSFNPISKGSKISKHSVEEMNKATEKARQMQIMGSNFPDKAVEDKGTHYEVVKPSIVKQYMRSFRSTFAMLLRQQVVESIRKNENNMRQIVKSKLSGTVERFLETDNPTPQEKEIALKKAMQMYIDDLCGHEFVSTDYLVLIGEAVGVDIYLIRHEDFIDSQGSNCILYGGKILHRNIRGPKDLRTPRTNKAERRSIILYSVADCHYELIGKLTCNQAVCGRNSCSITTNFSIDEPLVRSLYKQLE